MKASFAFGEREWNFSSFQMETSIFLNRGFVDAIIFLALKGIGWLSSRCLSRRAYLGGKD